MRSKAKPPTKSEQERIRRAKEAGCLACWLRGFGPVFGEYHHTLSGGKRRGHRFGFCLCPGHHRGEFNGVPYEEWKRKYGPSLAKEPKAFREAFLADDEFIAFQDQVLEIYQG